MAEMFRRDGDEREGRPPISVGGKLCLDGRIGLGSLINLIVLAVGLAAFFIRIDARVASLEDNFTEFKGDVKAALLRLEDKLDHKLDRPAFAMPEVPGHFVPGKRPGTEDATAGEERPAFLAPER